MTQDEFELKLMLSKEQYEKLSEIFPDSKCKKVVQTNYYYDTINLDMRKKNTTVRVREKNGKYKLTIKRHYYDCNYSAENNLSIDYASEFIMVEGKKLKLFGELTTERTEIKLCDGITLMLDYNRYLDIEDYELELEYVPKSKEKAEGMMLALQAIICYTGAPNLSKSKSERFFENLLK